MARARTDGSVTAGSKVTVTVCAAAFGSRRENARQSPQAHLDRLGLAGPLHASHLQRDSSAGYGLSELVVDGHVWARGRGVTSGAGADRPMSASARMRVDGS